MNKINYQAAISATVNTALFFGGIALAIFISFVSPPLFFTLLFLAIAILLVSGFWHAQYNKAKDKNPS